MNTLAILRPTSFDQLVQFGNFAAKSAMVPVAYRGKPEDIVLAIQLGSELGLAPMQALQNIAVINGRPSIWGDAMLALCKQHPAWGGIRETVAGEGDAIAATCQVSRKGDNPVSVTFTVADAKRAGLWGKTGPWTTYPARMLQMRARGFALRDAFPDALRGLVSGEEATDGVVDGFDGPTIDAKPEPIERDPLTIENATTASDLMKAIGAALGGAMTAEEVDAIHAHPRVQAALDRLTGPTQKRLQDMIAEALSRTAPANEGDQA